MESLAPAPPAQAIAVLPRSSILVAALSTVVEWYDFTLYLYMTTVLSRVFFGTGSTSLLITLAVFAVAYLMRPLGAMAFGHIGDRLGRRKVLLGSMAVMTSAMLATALLPTRDQIGSAAGVTALTVTLVPGPALDAWGWRIPFLFGTLLATTVLIARSTMRESPAFEQQPPPDTKGAGPLMTTLRTQRPALYRTFAISALGSVTYYVGISYVPTYLGAVSGFSESDALWLSTIAALVVIVVTPFAGALSDRVGRRPALTLFGALAVILPPAMFGLMTQGSFAAALTGAIVLACVAGGISAVAASAIAEQFPVAQRLSGLALGATAATALFGGLTPYASQALVDSTGWALIPGALVAATALAVLPVLRRLPETAPAIRAPQPGPLAPEPEPQAR
ncbi:MFS transporter [Streptomyces sp. NBC_00091]|uniref:MFS transporter n=1 Tax=Streptomyces sp. NBC_00091 TaxID=2975648 RepID=UPI0022590C1B|nr:MFS transporter [Streptomyces sp. NBC_00091]MCX5380200.1 MFS transporter [Streptomyces sp. NBC_00091]MCX5380933.1 MFS transporter [Streptomyces sp. NBC_00091]MCX5381668.1 MFS transporter [Streptomyces sp. NBC_00091]